LKEQLEAMLAAGRDSSSLRYALARYYFDDGDYSRAVEHAQVAVQQDADYSAAWRLLGQAQAAAGREAEAAQSFECGIEVAAGRGDRQVEKEMRVFLKRLKNAEKKN
jgi:predicted Zn-dependent protease